MRLLPVLGKRQAERLDKAPVVSAPNREAAANSDAPPALAETTPEISGKSTNAPPSEEYTQTTRATRRFEKHRHDYPHYSALASAHESDNSPGM